ncbi:peptide-methionine (S)-S-oxide reductase MsrA [Patescibacteria group bacterium]|nr:peptide-methionine (S)-S-oxide reductase MsrA [Patescibacteria group bacterium]
MASSSQKKAIFAGGCFWCIEAAMEELDGVTEAVNGYIGGTVENPSYEQVSTGTTGHLEATEVTFDPAIISYQELLDRFWLNTDPTDTEGQFSDKGPQYRTAIFYMDDKQKKLAEESIESLQRSGKYQKPIVTQLLEATTFYPAEEYHQDYYKKKRVQYQAYKKGSGREDYIQKQQEK